MDAKATRAIKRLALLFLLTAVGTRAQNVPYSNIVISAAGRPIAGAGISVCNSPGLATTAASVSSNLVTLTMASNPITAGFAANMTLQVSGFTGGDTYLNGGTLSGAVITGGFTILSVTSSTIVYQLSHANASATSNGFAFQQGNISTPCAPLASITSDQLGLVPITQPGLVSNNLGNYGFYAAAASYTLQYNGAGVVVQLQPIVLPCGGAATCTFSGTQTFTGPTSFKNVIQILMAGPSPWIDITNPTYAGGALGTWNGTTGADDTAAIQAAENACPASGGTIFYPGTANSYGISGKITVASKCWHVGVGIASWIRYTNESSANFPKLFCNSGSNVVISGLNLSNNITPTSLLLWTNSEATINGQEGFFCLGCTDLEVKNTIANNLGGAGFLTVRGAREHLHDDIANGSVRYGFYLLSDDSGTPTDDQLDHNTCSNNGSFGNSGFQGRGIVVTIAGSILPVVGAVNTKINFNVCNGNSLYGIEVYRASTYTELGFNTTAKNGLGGIHEYNNAYTHTHDNNIYGNGLPNVPNEAGGTLPGITGYCVRNGGSYFDIVINNDCHDNNFGGGNAGQIVINGEGDFTGSFGNIVKNNTIRNNGGSGQDIFISSTANNSFASTTVFYKVTAYDCSRNVLAQSGEVSKATSATSVNLLVWAPVQNACSYGVFRGATTGNENQLYLAYANAFMDENATALATQTPPGSGTVLTGLAITNFTTPSDTISTVVVGNIMIGSSTTGTSEIAGSATYSSMADNIGTGVAFAQTQQGDRNGIVTCVTNTIQKVYQNPFTNVPTIILFDETTKGGANLTAKDRFSFTVSCTGASDVVDYWVIPNPF